MYVLLEGDRNGCDERGFSLMDGSFIPLVVVDFIALKMCIPVGPE